MKKEKGRGVYIAVQRVLSLLHMAYSTVPAEQTKHRGLTLCYATVTVSRSLFGECDRGLGRKRLGCLGFRVDLFMASSACTTGNPLNTSKSFHRRYKLQPATLAYPPLPNWCHPSHPAPHLFYYLIWFQVHLIILRLFVLMQIKDWQAGCVCVCMCCWGSHLRDSLVFSLAAAKSFIPSATNDQSFIV